MTTLLWLISSIVAGIVGFCFFIDRIATADFKAHVAKLLTGHSSAVERTTVAQHVQRYIAGTVGYYFGGEYFSWQNVGRSFFLTLLALAVIVPATCIVNRKSPSDLLTVWGELDSYTNLMMVAFLVVACFFIDMVSFLQTAMFMRLTAYVPRFRDMVAMAFFDIVVTLNLFSMMFAAFLVPVVSYVDHRGTVMEVEALEFGSVPERKAEKDEKKDPMEVLRTDGLGLVELWYKARRPGDEKWSAMSSGKVGLKGYSASEVLKTFFRTSGANRDSVHDGVQQSGRERKTVTATLNASGILRRLSLPMMYQFIYSQSHVVQDSFLGLLQLALLTMEPTTLLGLDDTYAASPLRYDLAYFSVCDGQARYEPSVEKRPECEKYGVLDIRAPMTSLYRQLMSHRSEVKPFPVSIIAASSLFLTLAFYVGLAVYAAIVFAARHASGLMLSDKYLDLKVAPLAIGAIYAILCLVPVGGIAMLLWTCAS